MSAATTGRVAAFAAASAFGAAYWTTMSSQSQLLGRFPNAGSASPARTVALTFDDGPNEPFTTALSELLDRRGVRATFFQVGQAVTRVPDASRALLAAGHVIGNHSHTHQLHRCFTERMVEDEIERAEQAFGEAVGLRPRLFRPPWLARSGATFRVLERRGLQPVSGTFCHPLEVFQPAGVRIASRAVARARPGRMIIFHDGYNGKTAERGRTLDAVARTVDRLGEDGWSFATVDELLGVPAYADPTVATSVAALR